MKTLSIKCAIYSFLICLMIFSEILQYNGLRIVGYLDELFEVVAIIIIAVHWKSIEKGDKRIISLSFFFICSGLLGNIIFKYQRNVIAIILDIVATIKGILFYFGIKYARVNSNQRRKIVKSSSTFLWLMCFIMLIFAIINLFANIGMSTEMRYGLKGFKFIAPNEGTCSLMFYAIISAFLCEAVYDNRIKNTTCIGLAMALCIWCLTLRSRAIAFSFLFLVLAIRFLTHKRTRKIRIYEIIGILAAAYFFGKDQIQYYFANTNTARYNLLSYGLLSFKRFFPLGSGFATYGSEMAARNYSTLYHEYGFNSVWGLAEDNLRFANDSLWGEVLGQFGLIGTILFILIFFFMFKNILRKFQGNIGKLASLYIIVILVLGTTGTKTFFHFTIVPTFMFLAFAERYYQENRFRGLGND